MAHENLSRTHENKSSSNRAFGTVFGTVFVIVGCFPLLSGGPLRWWALVLAAVIFAIALLAPSLLAAPNRLWTAFGLWLNRLISPVILAFIYYVVVTPMGWILRLRGKGQLPLRPSPTERSYWISRTPPGPSPDSLKNQF